jgi:hypothetical protein
VEKQNITLSIRKEILQKVKLLAVKRETSVSAMVTEALEGLVTQAEGYQAARRNHLRTLREESSLCTYGEANWKRDDLHDR